MYCTLKYVDASVWKQRHDGNDENNNIGNDDAVTLDGREPPDRSLPGPGEQDRHASGSQRRRTPVRNEKEKKTVNPDLDTIPLHGLLRAPSAPC